jgi:hypothetical protein
MIHLKDVLQILYNAMGNDLSSHQLSFCKIDGELVTLKNVVLLAHKKNKEVRAFHNKTVMLKLLDNGEIREALKKSIVKFNNQRVII